MINFKINHTLVLNILMIAKLLSIYTRRNGIVATKSIKTNKSTGYFGEANRDIFKLLELYNYSVGTVTFEYVKCK